MSIHCDSARYQVPSLLRDLVLLDMLEITGSTVAAAQLLNMSQPNASRRYRRLATELGVQPNRHRLPGRRFADADWIRLLRQGVNRHRLACGVLRLGGPADIGAVVRRWPWVEWLPLPQKSLAHRDALLEHQLLDGVVLDCEPQASQSNDGPMPVLMPADQGLWLCCRSDPSVQALAQRLLAGISRTAQDASAARQRDA